MCENNVDESSLIYSDFARLNVIETGWQGQKKQTCDDDDLLFVLVETTNCLLAWGWLCTHKCSHAGGVFAVGGRKFQLAPNGPGNSGRPCRCPSGGYAGRCWVPAFLAPAPLAVMLVLAPSQSFQSLLRRLCWHWQMLEASSDLANFVLGKLHAPVPLAFGVHPRKACLS